MPRPAMGETYDRVPDPVDQVRRHCGPELDDDGGGGGGTYHARHAGRNIACDHRQLEAQLLGLE